MAMSLQAASDAMREAVHETVKRHSLWYLLQGIFMVLVGIFALLFPLFASVAIVLILGWTHDRPKGSLGPVGQKQALLSRTWQLETP